MSLSSMSALSFEERLALLIDQEIHGRHDKRCARLLKTAKLKYPQASIEELDKTNLKGATRSAVMSLALGQWVGSGHAVLITGPTGAGKSWLACALAQHACRQGHSVLYLRVPRLGEELRIRHANGTFVRWLDTLKNTAVLLLDDWGMSALDSATRADLLEIIDDRAMQRATIVTSQLPIEHWQEWIGDATIADALLDRLMQSHHRFTLSGESLRKKKPAAKSASGVSGQSKTQQTGSHGVPAELEKKLRKENPGVRQAPLPTIKTAQHQRLGHDHRNPGHVHQNRWSRSPEYAATDAR